MHFVSMYFKEEQIMDRAKTKVLVSILKDSSLYQTMSHEEKNSLLSRLEKDYPTIFKNSESQENEGTKNH